MTALPLYLMLGTTVLLYCFERWSLSANMRWITAVASLIVCLMVLALVGNGGAFQNRFLLDRFSLTIIITALGGILVGMVVRRSIRDSVGADDFMALSGLCAAAGAQDILLCFTGLAVAIFALTRSHRLTRASRLLSPPVIAVGLMGIGIALVIALSGTSSIVDVRMSLGITQVNHKGDIGMILIPALIAFVGALVLLLAPPPLDHWLRRSTRFADSASALTMLLWPLIILVYISRVFIGMFYVYSDPVMSPNDWGVALLLVIGVAMVAVTLQGRREHRQSLVLFRAWQFQLLAIPLGLLAVSSDGLAASLAMAVIVTINTCLLMLLPEINSQRLAWPALLTAAAMIGFPGVAGFVVRLATLDAVAAPHSLSFYLSILIAVHFAALAIFSAALVRLSVKLYRDRRAIPTAQPVKQSFSPFVITAVIIIMIASAMMTPSLLTTLTPAGDLFGLTMR